MVNKDTVLVPLLTTWAQRNFYYSGFLDYLNDNYNLIIVSNSKCSWYPVNIKNISIEANLNSEFIPTNPLLSKISSITLWLRNEIHYSFKPSATVKIKRELGIKNPPTKAWFLVYHLLRHLPQIDKILECLLNKIYSKTRLGNKLLNIIEPLGDPILFVPSTIYQCDRVAAHVGRQKNLKVIGYIWSWDNLSSKGVLPITFDGICVWGQHMESELLYRYGKALFNKCARIGNLGFHFYRRKEIFENRAAQAGEGLITWKQIKHQFLYCCCSPSLAPNEHELIHELIRYLSDLEVEIQFIIRVHPKDNGSRFQHLSHEYGFVDIDIPNNDGDAKYGNFNHQDHLNFCRLIDESTLILNMFSTITLDAIFRNKPVINFQWSAFDKDKTVCEANIHVNYEHFKVLIKNDVLNICKDINDFILFLSKYFNGGLELTNEKKDIAIKVIGQNNSEQFTNFKRLI